MRMCLLYDHGEMYTNDVIAELITSKIYVTVERAEVVLHSSFLWSLRWLVWWRGFRTVQGTVLNRA